MDNNFETLKQMLITKSGMLEADLRMYTEGNEVVSIEPTRYAKQKIDELIQFANQIDSN